MLESRRRRGYLWILLLGAVSGCSTYRTLEPTLQAERRVGLEVAEPLVVSVIDGRTQTDGSDVVASERLLESLRTIYGDAIRPQAFFERVPNGSLGLRIRIRELGASFGSRVVNQTLIAQLDTEVAASSNWGPLIARVQERRNLLASSLVAEGWWIGTAWLDIEIIDRRNGDDEFGFPLVAEARQSNTFGYSSAEDATQEAWRTVSSDLLYVMDEVFTEIRR